jgi:hypothetical protein
VADQVPGFDFGDSSRGSYLPWIPAIVGLGIVASLLLAVLLLRPAGGTDTPTAGRVTTPAVQPPAAPVLTPVPPSPSASVTPRSVSPRPRSPAAPSRVATVATATRSAVAGAPRTVPPADVTGRYRVVSTYQMEFIAEVLVSNAWGSPRHWSVQLRFGSNVGTLRAFWVNAQEQPSMRRSGDSYIFTSSVPLAARSSAALRMRFDRWGPNIMPESCTTNGLTCAGT